jgi:hypothetical protein
MPVVFEGSAAPCPLPAVFGLSLVRHDKVLSRLEVVVYVKSGVVVLQRRLCQSAREEADVEGDINAKLSSWV